MEIRRLGFFPVEVTRVKRLLFYLRLSNEWDRHQRGSSLGQRDQGLGLEQVTNPSSTTGVTMGPCRSLFDSSGLLVKNKKPCTPFDTRHPRVDGSRLGSEFMSLF